MPKDLFIRADNRDETLGKGFGDRLKAMDVSQVQSSIEAVNQLVAMVVSRSTAMIQDMVAVDAKMAAADVAQQQSAEVAQSVEPGLGEQIDLLI